MRQRPPLPPPDDGAEAPARPPEGLAGLRPLPAHDGPFVPPGAGFAPAASPDPIAPPPAPEAPAPEPDPSDLPTVEELADRFGLHARDERERDTQRFVRNVLWANEGYAQGQRVSPQAFSDALYRARNLQLNGSPDPGRKRLAARRAR